MSKFKTYSEELQDLGADPEFLNDLAKITHRLSSSPHVYPAELLPEVSDAARTLREKLATVKIDKPEEPLVILLDNLESLFRNGDPASYLYPYGDFGPALPLDFLFTHMSVETPFARLKENKGGNPSGSLAWYYFLPGLAIYTHMLCRDAKKHSMWKIIAQWVNEAFEPLARFGEKDVDYRILKNLLDQNSHERLNQVLVGLTKNKIRKARGRLHDPIAELAETIPPTPKQLNDAMNRALDLPELYRFIDLSKIELDASMKKELATVQRELEDCGESSFDPQRLRALNKALLSAHYREVMLPKADDESLSKRLNQWWIDNIRGKTLRNFERLGPRKKLAIEFSAFAFLNWSTKSRQWDALKRPSKYADETIFHPRFRSPLHLRSSAPRRQLLKREQNYCVSLRQTCPFLKKELDDWLRSAPVNPPPAA
jgi:hypothetical protein